MSFMSVLEKFAPNNNAKKYLGIWAKVEMTTNFFDTASFTSGQLSILYNVHF